MNLNKFKKTIGKTNPEKGLRNLVGAQKMEQRDLGPGTVRVKGVYRSVDHGRSGNFFGILAYVAALLTSICMMGSIFFPYLGNPMAYFCIGILPVHGFAMISDGINSSKTPWAGKSIKLFWSAAALVIVTSILYALIMA